MTGDRLSRKNIFRKLIIFFMILGPGIITGSVDNDAGGITTYSLAGAQYGYGLIWTLIPSFIVLVVIQEMNARMGIVTGKGLADLIRENAGLKITFFIFIGLLLSGIGNTTTEFAGVAGSIIQHRLIEESKHLKLAARHPSSTWKVNSKRYCCPAIGSEKWIVMSVPVCSIISYLGRGTRRVIFSLIRALAAFILKDPWPVPKVMHGASAECAIILRFLK